LWRRPVRMLADVVGMGWSPDGKSALFGVLHNDGDCYGSHIGPEELKTVTDDGAPQIRALLQVDYSLGSAAWSPDGSKVAYTDCGRETCNLGVITPDGGQPRQLTHFPSDDQPTAIYLPFRWAGEGDELVLGRFLSVLSLDPISGRIKRLVKAPCPRRSHHCPLPVIAIVGLSPHGLAVIDVGDVSGQGPVRRRYATDLTNRQLTPLPNPGLLVDDLYLP
jgi:hypothetical protein